MLSSDRYREIFVDGCAKIVEKINIPTNPIAASVIGFVFVLILVIATFFVTVFMMIAVVFKCILTVLSTSLVAIPALIDIGHIATWMFIRKYKGLPK